MNAKGAQMKTKAFLVAAALSIAAVTPAWSGTPLPPPGGSGPGPGVVVGPIISVLSVMICAQWSCQTTNHEMTPEQAILAATLPLSCLWLKRPPTPQGPVCSGPPH